VEPKETVEGKSPVNGGPRRETKKEPPRGKSSEMAVLELKGLKTGRPVKRSIQGIKKDCMIGCQGTLRGGGKRGVDQEAVETGILSCAGGNRARNRASSLTAQEGWFEPGCRRRGPSNEKGSHSVGRSAEKYPSKETSAKKRAVGLHHTWNNLLDDGGNLAVVGTAVGLERGKKYPIKGTLAVEASSNMSHLGRRPGTEEERLVGLFRDLLRRGKKKS